jgi:hypothetical protein
LVRQRSPVTVDVLRGHRVHVRQRIRAKPRSPLLLDGLPSNLGEHGALGGDAPSCSFWPALTSTSSSSTLTGHASMSRRATLSAH